MVRTVCGGKTTTREMRLRRDLEARRRDGQEELFFEQFAEVCENDPKLARSFSFRGLIEQLVPDGEEIVRSWNPRQSTGVIPLYEAGDAVTSSAFSRISGQIIYNEVMQAFNDEAFVFSPLVPTISTQFSGETIPGIGRMGDVARVIEEGQPYTRAGLNPDWIQTPTTEKRGLMIDLTREAVFFDRTNLIMERAKEVGAWLGLNREKRIIDAFIDENQTRHQYTWKGTSYATYQTATPWDNITATAALVDWTDIDEAEQTLASILDPNTGEPIMSMPRHLVVTRQNLYAAKRIINATEVAVTTPGYATTANPSQTRTANPISNYTIVSSQLLASRMATDTTWYLGDISKMIRYMENFPLQVEQAPANSGDMFERDIVASFKAGERGAAVVIEPRVTTKCTA